MNRFYFIWLVFLLLPYINYSQEVVWVNDSSSVDNVNFLNQSTVDNNNNLFIGGYFRTNMTIGDQAFSSVGVNDSYVTKVSSSGEITRTIQLESVTNVFIKTMNYSDDGFLYVGGFFSSDLTINSITITNTGGLDGFMAKFDNDLNLVWLKNIVYSSTYQTIKGIVFANNNDIYISGEFKDSIIFNTSTPDTVVSTDVQNVYVAKMDVNGNILSYNTSNGADDLNLSLSTSIDDNDNLYMSCIYKGNLNVDGNISSSLGNFDGYIVKLDNNLNYVWVRKIQGTGIDKALGIDLNATSLFISGTYTSTDLIIDSTETLQSTITPPNNGSADMFTLSYDFDGNLLWSKYFGSTGTDYLYDIEANDDVVFFSGYYPATFDYDDSTIVNNNSSNDALLLMVSPTDGQIQQYYALGEEGDDRGATINLVKNGLNNQFFATGTFKSDSIYIGNDTLRNSHYTRPDYSLTSNVQDIFIARFGCKDITIAFDSILATCPTGSNGALKVLPSDTIGISWTYEWQGTNATGQTVDSLGGLLDAEWYYTTITSPKGCAYNDSIMVTHKPVLQASLIDTLTLNCLASTDGVAAVIPSLGNIQGDTLTSDYHYLWSDGVTDSLRIDLEVGQYFVTIQDLCADTTEVIDTINIGHLPTLQAHIQTQNVIVLCDTSSNGIGRVDYTDGKAPYSFYWENSNTDTTSAVANDLTVGWHTVTITDFCNVPIIDSVNIVNMPSLSTQITYSQNATCIGNLDGVATISPFNGVEPFIYTWSASASDTTSASDLPGDSMIYVTVSDICRDVVDSVQIGVNPEMTIALGSIENATCTTTNDGYAQVYVLSGQGNITYTWSASASDSTIANDLPGDSLIFVTVSDMCGTKIDSAEIGVNPLLEIDFINIQNTNCTNSTDGSAEVTLTNEQGTVSYLWSNDSTTAINTALPAGYAIVSVTDICGQLVDSVEILTELPLAAGTVSTDNTCYGDSLGTATISTLNEYGIVLYSWNTGDTTAVIDSLASGTYYYTVTDECLDVISDSVTIESPTAITDTVIIVNETLYGNADGSATLTVSGGTTPYIIAWSNNDIGNMAEYLSAGTYTYVIRDANNCELSDSVVIIADEYEVVVYNAFTPNADGVNDVWNIKYIDNFPDATVQIFNQWGAEVFSSNGYSEPWDGTMDGSELPAGTYYYIIRLGDDYKDKSGSVTIIK